MNSEETVMRSRQNPDPHAARYCGTTEDEN